MDVTHSSLHLCLKATGYSREIAVIKYTGWLLSHLVPVCSALEDDTKKGLWILQDAWMRFCHSLGYSRVVKLRVWLVCSSFRISLILEVQTCYCKQSPFSVVGILCSQENLWAMRSQWLPASNLLHLLMGEGPIGCPSGPSIWIWVIRWNAECGKSFGSQKGNHSQKIPPHMATSYLLWWLLFWSVFSLFAQIIRGQLENTFLMAVVK